MTRCWLDVGMGDQQEHRRRTERFEAFEAYVRATGAAQIGAAVPAGGDATAGLAPEELQMLGEMYAADPAGEAGAVLERPADLLVGRLVVELDVAGCPRASENFRCMCVRSARVRSPARGSGIIAPRS